MHSNPQGNPSSGDLSNPEFNQLPSCGDFDMRIARDGTWFYRGSPIGRKPLVKLFSTVLRREDGEFWLVTPVERGRILVDDAPFIAVEVTAQGRGRDQILVFRTNVDEEIAAGPDNPIRVAYRDGREPSPYIMVRNGLEALILRSVFYHLVEMGELREVDGMEQLGVWSGGAFFPLGATQLPEGDATDLVYRRNT